MHVDHENIKRHNQVNSMMEILQDYKLGSWDTPPPKSDWFITPSWYKEIGFSLLTFSNFYLYLHGRNVSLDKLQI